MSTPENHTPLSDQPLVSVIVSVYNGEQGIGDALSSLEAQTYHRLEIIVVDDGSIDRTVEVVRQHTTSDSRIRLVQHEENLHLAAGRNTGIRNSSGAIICFTDDDCIADRRWIEELVNVYRARPDVDGVGGRIEPYHPSSILEKYASFGKNKVYDHTPAVGFQSRFTRYLRKFFSWSPITLQDGQAIESVMGMNSSYLREALERIQGFDPTLTKGEDWDANIRAIKAKAGTYFDPNLFRGVDWEINIRLQKQREVLFVFCAQAVIYHKNRQGIHAFLHHLYSYGKAYTDVAKRHPDILLLPYPAPILFFVGVILGLFYPLFWVIPVMLYLKDAPYILSSIVRTRDWSYALFPIIDIVRESTYNLGIMARLLRRQGPT